MKPLSAAGHALSALALAAAGPAFAGPIGEPSYSIRLLPRDANTNLPPEHAVVLESSTDAVDGQMSGSIVLGPYVLTPAQAELSAGVVDDGQTFWTNASTPLATSLPRPPDSLIGGDVSVELVQTFRKDSADASLDFTLGYGLLEFFRDMERGIPCNGCIRAELGWEAEVYLTSDPGTLLWREGQSASLFDDNGVLTLEVFALKNTAPVNPLWQWECARCGGPSFQLGQAQLEAPYTGIVDLSGIAFDPSLPPEAQPEFAVRYTLYAQVFDMGAFSGAGAFSRDPLAGDGSGLAFTIEGLTPTNGVVGAVPEPGTWALMLAGLGVVGRLASRRRRDA